MEIYKKCKKCGKIFCTEEEFIANTKFIGIQSFSPYKQLNLELRDCSCKTTLARTVSIDNIEKMLNQVFA